MTNKATKYGLIIIAAVLLVAMAFAGAASATIYIDSVDDWKNKLSGKSITDDVVLSENLQLDFGGADYHIASLTKTFEGNGSVIYNFTCNYGGNEGLIRQYSGSRIANITIMDFQVKGNMDYTGGLVGSVSTSTSTFENVHVMNGEVSGYASGSEHSGGIIGSTSGNVRLVNCTVENCTVGVRDGMGGLVGTCMSGIITIESCAVDSCRIYGREGRVGGMIGWVKKECSGVYVHNSSVRNNVITTSSGTCSGCLGTCEYMNQYVRSVVNCTVSNSVISAVSGICGGIIGSHSKGTSTIFPEKYPSVSDCTVEYCTIATNSGTAGGIAGNFPVQGVLDRNKVVSSCVVSKTGKAAGICPAL